MVKVRGQIDMSREAEEISDLASFVLDKLKLMETSHPYLKDAYPQYRSLRNRIEQFLVNPPENKTALGNLFDDLRECLHHISDERNSRITTGSLSPGRLIPSNYLPMSFALLLQDFAESNLHSGTISPLADATEDLLFGDAIIEQFPHHRDRIRKRLLDALVCDYGRVAEISSDLAEYGDNLFKLIKLPSGKLYSLSEALDVEPLEAAVALIILRTRARIGHKRGMRAEPAPIYATSAPKVEEDV